MKVKSRQWIFDKAAKHLLKQGEQAKVKGACVYRKEIGNKKKVLRCVVGCFIPRSKYNHQIEGYGVNADRVQVILTSLGLTEFDLMNRLQSIHDNCHAGAWPVELARLARFYNLNEKVLA